MFFASRRGVTWIEKAEGSKRLYPKGDGPSGGVDGGYLGARESPCTPG